MPTEWIRDHGALTNSGGSLQLKEALHSNQSLLPALLGLSINFLSVVILHAPSKLDGHFFPLYLFWEARGKLFQYVL